MSFHRSRVIVRSSVSGFTRALGTLPSSGTFCLCVAVRMTRSPTRQPVHRFRQHNAGRPLGRRRSQLDPRAAQNGAMKVHPATATDNRRTVFRVKSFDQRQPDQRPVFFRNRP